MNKSIIEAAKRTTGITAFCKIGQHEVQVAAFEMAKAVKEVGCIECRTKPTEEPMASKPRLVKDKPAEDETAEPDSDERGQMLIPGTEPPPQERHKDLEAAANKYAKFRDERIAAGGRESDAKKDMEALLEAYKIDPEVGYRMPSGKKIYCDVKEKWYVGDE